MKGCGWRRILDGDPSGRRAASVCWEDNTEYSYSVERAGMAVVLSVILGRRILLTVRAS